MPLFPLSESRLKIISHCLVAGLVASLFACAHTPANNSLSGAVSSNINSVKPELLVQRLSWGINSSSAQLARQLGAAAYLQQQLNPSASSAPHLPQVVQDQIAAMTISQTSLADILLQIEQLQQAANKPDGAVDGRKKLQQELNRLAREAQARAILRALYSPHQLQEQLCWFWLNHFNVFQGKAHIRAMVGDYEEQAIRPHVLGRFRELLSATAHHPAMLRYLDNVQNAVNRPNENYAREIMELHTMGVEGGYSQRDVQELARILTGVGFNLKNQTPPHSDQLQSHYVRNGLFEFNPRRHDFGDKQFLGHTIKGQGLAELDQAIELLSRHPATAHFVSNKLALFFVGDSPSPALVDNMAQTFLSSDGDIKAVLITLFSSAEFTQSLGQQFKDPQHYIFSALRLAYDTKPILNTMPVINWLSRLGQPRFGKLTPDGYALTASAWNSPAQMTTRFDIAKAIGSGRAELFNPENSKEAAGFPNLSNALYFEYIQQTLSSTTLKTLDQATSAQEWNTLLLASPEMMMR